MTVQTSLYSHKAEHEYPASSIRLRWYGHLAGQGEIFLEKKTVLENDASNEQRISIKKKYIQPFIKGEYKLEKTIEKTKARLGDDSEQVRQIQENVNDIQNFLVQNNLQPVLRANYTRTAFQIPGDDRVRISLDTNLAFIREDAIDTERPVRDPNNWHRDDIDSRRMEFPFEGIRKGEVNVFPYCLLEIKVKESPKQQTWVHDLMNSHLVKKAPRFSKFVHGVAQLFEDYVNTFPYWLSDLETDIRRDPDQAWQEEQKEKKKAAEDESAVGSLVRSKSYRGSYKPQQMSPVGSPSVSHSSKVDGTSPGKANAAMTRRASNAARLTELDEVTEEANGDDEGAQVANRYGGREQRTAGERIRDILPSFSTSKYARRKREIQLPPGVKEPEVWIKQQGPVKVEAKVWLANERTFIKWQHVSVLLASLSIGLYNAAGENNNVARALAVVYTLVAVFAGVWGWGMYQYRRTLILDRSGKEFDNRLGPCLICISLIVALCLNSGFKVSSKPGATMIMIADKSVVLRSSERAGSAWTRLFGA